MELDELKRAWKQSPADNNINTDIMNIIQHKSYGPVVALKRTFRKQIIMMASIPFLLIATNFNDLRLVFTSILFWSYVAFCIGAIIFAAYNYRIAKRMELMDGVVKANLEQHIDLLEKRKKIELLGMRGVLLFFIVLTEVVPYLQHYRMLDKWHSLPVVIRFGAYAMLLLLQYRLNESISQKKVGRHLDYLKSLVKEMQ
jgi:hypothetical protein